MRLDGYQIRVPWGKVRIRSSWWSDLGSDVVLKAQGHSQGRVLIFGLGKSRKKIKMDLEEDFDMHDANDDEDDDNERYYSGRDDNVVAAAAA
ncbi:hypothetical protein TorRG33x02_311700 [Trema orientale]|uniref:Uncharacterized protein n=1 Tax=Trema orientale TaxID=63057 RepID=A0A2P5BR92_TREOI|nr:hypothetical protein TorRG33x02_311700 [Trema orientale]